MSPLTVHNRVLYQDRTVQDWHRYELPADCVAIDLDLMGYCKTCGEPLYFIEASTNPDKRTGVLRTLAYVCSRPAFLVWHHDGVVTGARIIHHPTQHGAEGQRLTTPQLKNSLIKIRRTHRCGGLP
jgi:hypothetical protein